MGKTAKTASKNNPTARLKQKKFSFNGRFVQPTKVIINNKSIISAEYEDSGEIVIDDNKNPMRWALVKVMSTT